MHQCTLPFRGDWDGRSYRAMSFTRPSAALRRWLESDVIRNVTILPPESESHRYAREAAIRAQHQIQGPNEEESMSNLDGIQNLSAFRAFRRKNLKLECCASEASNLKRGIASVYGTGMLCVIFHNPLSSTRPRSSQARRNVSRNEHVCNRYDQALQNDDSGGGLIPIIKADPPFIEDVVGAQTSDVFSNGNVNTAGSLGVLRVDSSIPGCA